MYLYVFVWISLVTLSDLLLKFAWEVEHPMHPRIHRFQLFQDFPAAFSNTASKWLTMVYA